MHVSDGVGNLGQGWELHGVYKDVVGFLFLEYFFWTEC